MLKNLMILAFLGLPGCATVQNHPIATSVVIGLVAGSIAASQNHDYRNSPVHPAMSTVGAPNCSTGACQ